jgi:hypothetical protein
MTVGGEIIEGSLLSPNIGNYYIGKGIVSIQLLGESEYTDCGNVPVFEFLAKITNLDHFSSRTGVRVKDFTAVIEIAGTLTIQLEELTARNVGFALLGLPNGGPSPSPDTITIFSNPVIYGSVKFVGTNDIGPNWTVIFPLVKLSPSKALSLIANTWGTVDLEGDVLFDNQTQAFGTATVTLPESPGAFGVVNDPFGN